MNDLTKFTILCWYSGIAIRSHMGYKTQIWTPLCQPLSP